MHFNKNRIIYVSYKKLFFAHLNTNLLLCRGSEETSDPLRSQTSNHLWSITLLNSCPGSQSSGGVKGALISQRTDERTMDFRMEKQMERGQHLIPLTYWINLSKYSLTSLSLYFLSCKIGNTVISFFVYFICLCLQLSTWLLYPVVSLS